MNLQEEKVYLCIAWRFQSQLNAFTGFCLWYVGEAHRKQTIHIMVRKQKVGGEEVSTLIP